MQAVPTREEISEALSTVLARPEFQHADPPALLTLLNQFRLWLLGLIMSLLSRLDVDVSSPAVVWVLRGMLVLAAGGLVVVLVRIALRHGWGSSTSPYPSQPGDEPEAKADTDWAVVADTAAREGRFREAVLALYQALLRRLEAAGVLRYDPAKTPGDYRREARPHPVVARNLALFLRLFEPVAFGGREPDSTVFERLRIAAREAAGE